MKTVAIYEFQPQMGGGQRVAYQMAETLSRKYAVTLLVPRPPNLQHLQQYFGVDFKNVTIGPPIPNGDHVVLPKVYDVFINAEYAYWAIDPGRAQKRFIVAHDAHPLGRKPDFMSSYTAVLPSSEYGKQKLMDEKWPLRARVLRPPSYPTTTLTWSSKPARFLVVARFDQFRNNNSLPTVIKGFQKACDDGLKDHELNIAGWVLNPAIYRKLWETAEIHKYPIRFWASPSQEQLDTLYIGSRYLLNLRGIDSPKPSTAFSHEALGLVTIEGIARGCIPIVHGFAGHMEVVPFPSLWIDNVEDIPGRLREIVERWDDKERKEIWGCCDRHARRLFTREAFLNDFDTLLGEFD